MTKLGPGSGSLDSSSSVPGITPSASFTFQSLHSTLPTIKGSHLPILSRETPTLKELKGFNTFLLSLLFLKHHWDWRQHPPNLYLKSAGSVLWRTRLMFRPISIQVNLVLLMSVKSDFTAESSPRTLSLIKGERSGTTNLVSLKGMYFHAH